MHAHTFHRRLGSHFCLAQCVRLLEMNIEEDALNACPRKHDQLGRLVFQLRPLELCWICLELRERTVRTKDLFG